MDRADIEKFRRHIGAGKTVQIGEDSFYFKPLTVRQLPDLLEVVGIMQKGEQELFKKENAQKLFSLLKEFVRNSYPTLEEEVLDEFVSANMMLLQETMVEVNSMTSSNVSESQKQKIKELKEKANGLQSTQKETA